MLQVSSKEKPKLEERALFSKAVGYEIRLLRKRRLLTGKDLAKLLDISQQQVSRYERGVCHMTVDMLILLLNLLDMPINEFLSRALVRISVLKFEYGYVSHDSFKKNSVLNKAL